MMNHTGMVTHGRKQNEVDLPQDSLGYLVPSGRVHQLRLTVVLETNISVGFLSLPDTEIVGWSIKGVLAELAGVVRDHLLLSSHNYL